jgi:hypothetical protein
MYGTKRGTTYGYSFYEIGVWESDEEPAKETCTVTVDGTVVETVAEGENFTLGTAKYGYYADGKMYPAEYTITVNENMEFSSVNSLSVSEKDGAGIKTTKPSGLRFQAEITSDNMEAVSAQDAITSGMLITTNDLFENNGQTLTLATSYQRLNIVNRGWYDEKAGTFCGSVSNIAEENYMRKFIARAYVTIDYVNGKSVTVYSNMSDVRSINYVANAVKSAGYQGLNTEEIAVIDSFL